MKKLLFGLVCSLVMVLGAQAQAATHSVALAWTNSTTACVTTTNVHRVTVKGTEAIGTNFAAVPVASSTFTDNTVVGGSTYFYTVSAWGPTCGGTNESVMSNEITAVIPADCVAPSTVVNGVCTAPPAAPTNLKATSIQ